MERYQQLLLENKAWAQEKKEHDPTFFERLSVKQKPDFLWIGCSDSRVDPNEFAQTKPGEVFIHRNIANLAVHTDLNLLSVMQYAVEVLEINHVVVCGHYGCGGVKAALSRRSFGMIDKWLRHIKEVYRLHQSEVDAVEDPEERVNKLVEWNVREQLYNIAKTGIIQKAWKQNRRPQLHGWVYDMQCGIIKPIQEINPGDTLPDSIFQYEGFPSD